MGRDLRRFLISLTAALLVLTALVSAQAGAQPAARYIVQLSDAPLASYRGGIEGLSPTNPAALGQVKLDPTSPASVAYLAYLAKQQADFLASAEQTLGHPLEAIFQYRYALNGVAVPLTETEAEKVATMPGVERLEREHMYELLTDAGPAWIGAPSIWDGSAVNGPRGTMGEGIVAGVIDTGVNHDHPSFADVGGDGFDHRNPRGTFYGFCDPLTGAPFCNDKLIGVRDFTGTGPLDDNQHGSHTASTVAGNVLDATIHAPTIDLTRGISGVAPHANLITYKACVAVGCLNLSTAAAIDQATADAVDVINFSIGGGSRNPWNDSSALAFLGARDAGVFVAASAGNSGPKPQTIGSPSNAPWLTSVGASTHNRKFVNTLAGMSGGGSAAPADISGKGVTSGYGPAAIVYAGDYGSALCGEGPAAPTGEALINPFPPGTFNGEIVVCDRGVYGRVEKGQNVKEGGAGGYVLANDQANGDSLVGDPHALPGVHITYRDGVALKAWLADGSGHTGSITGMTTDLTATNGDVMASFSSRGPDKSVPDVLKPDVTAPGVDVLAAVHTTNPLSPPEYGVLSGTSMSGPHTAGAAALVRAIHSTWTPAEVQSALMATSLTDGVRKEDGLKPSDAFDRGAGRVDLTKAAKAGLVLDEQAPDYEAANPATGGDPTTLNHASLADAQCEATCTWTRTVTSTLGSSATWRVSTVRPRGMTLSVSPSRFTLGPGASQTLTVTANVSKMPVGQWLFGEVRLTSSAAPAAHWPVAVLPGGAPTPVDIETTSSSGSHTVTYTSKVDISRLTTTVYGLQQGEVTRRQLLQDPTPLQPYDGLGGTFDVAVSVPAGSKVLAAEIEETTSTDLDLFVGLDADGDSRPDANEEVCRSASEIAFESCKLAFPEGGTYWVMVQNWLFGQVPDDVELAVTVVPGADNGNLTVTGPQSVSAGQPFDLTLSWNEPGLDPGETWFALVELGSDRKHPSNVGSLLVKIARTG
jgi:subtilisin family serine protease